jgi:alkanesulfonate monooxygenase SsuD/methylene tetrahydromethanopterin reductase-like flavin-dependent oxidoreductase (luciferase family)
MATRVGYLLPTREQVMEGRPEAKSLLDLATRAERLGFDAIWVGDSLLARPRHEPLTLLAAVAGRVPRVALGTAVLLPALRNPVVLAHTVATLDQASEGRLILGVGIARDTPDIRAEFMAAGVPFERRVGRMLDGLRLMRALWSGNPVDWDGFWSVKGGVLGPTPYQTGGPPFWLAGSLPVSLERTGRHFQGWLPNVGTPEQWRTQWAQVRQHATEAGRDAAAMTGSMYLTLCVDETQARADASLDRYLESYYNAPAPVLRKRQACYAGPMAGASEWIGTYIDAGVDHIVLRFAGDHERHLDAVARLRRDAGW